MQKMLRITLTVSGVLATLPAAGPAFAQTEPGAAIGYITVSARVEQALATASTTELSLANLTATGPRRIDPGDPRAAGFRIRGTVGTEIVLSFSLPNELRHTSGSGEAIAFRSEPTSGRYQSSSGRGSPTYFDPASPVTVTVDSAGELEVFVGGEVEPDSTTAAGTYRGIMVLRTHYTGI